MQAQYIFMYPCIHACMYLRVMCVGRRSVRIYALLCM